MSSEQKPKSARLSLLSRWALSIFAILLLAITVAAILKQAKKPDLFFSPLAIDDGGMFWLIRHFPGIAAGTYEVTAIGALPDYLFSAEYQLRQGGAILATDEISITMAAMPEFDNEPAWTTTAPTWDGVDLVGEAEVWCRVSWSALPNQYNEAFLEYGVCIYGDTINPPDADNFHFLEVIDIETTTTILFPMIWQHSK